MFTIRSHGVRLVEGLSSAQHRLLTETKPIRVCGAPTGAGKTYAFFRAAERGERVLFVVPTQALARDIEESARQQGVPAYRWDGLQSAQIRSNGGEPWTDRKMQWDRLLQTGGMVITTPETLAQVLLGYPELKHTRLLVDLPQIQHLVFDEAHTLTTRAFGFLHFWAVLAAWRHRIKPDKSLKLTLLSATHSNLFEAFFRADKEEEAYLPEDLIAFFNEEIENEPQEGLRILHGDVEVHIGDGNILTCLKQYASEPLRQGARLLVLYDSLRALTRDEPAMRDLFASYGIKPDECFLINGQDRKAGGLSLGGTGFEAGLYPQEKHRIVIATSCLEAGVNIEGLRYAVLDPGPDAAALLQRIGRIARGTMDGKIWLTTPERRPDHWLKLKELSGTLSITDLYQKLAPLRHLPLDQARRLGSAYWSMLKRKQPALYNGLLGGHKSLSQAKAPGADLDRLHAEVETTMCRYRDRYKKWLKQIDQELADLRGFSPSVTIQFEGYPPVEYSRDWALAYLERPEQIDKEGIWRYRKPRSAYLLDRPKQITLSLLCPDGSNFTREYFPCNVCRAYLDYAKHLEAKTREFPEQDAAFLAKAASFIKATGLLVREKIEDYPVF